VQVTRRGNMLIGQGHELAAHHMEIRGVGLIDIPALFGIRAVRQQKRVEVVVQLEDWDSAREADRTGLAQQEAEYLGVTLPRVIVPLNPGKNITVVSEVVAIEPSAPDDRIDTAAAFNERLIRRMREKKGLGSTSRRISSDRGTPRRGGGTRRSGRRAGVGGRGDQRDPGGAGGGVQPRL